MNITTRFRMVMAICAVAVVAVCTSFVMPSTKAHAQTGGGVLSFKSAGPIQLNHDESALIGLLLPAVQRTGKPFHLELFDSMGKLMVDIPVMSMGEGSVQSAFFDVTFMEGNLKVMEHSTGKMLVNLSHSDGMLIALLLPAVQPTGRSMGPLSASIQIFDSMKQRGQVIQLCDGSV